MKILLVLFCYIPAMANAYDLQRAQTNLASDYAACASYYMIATHILNDNDRNSTAAEAVAKNAVNMAVELSNKKVTTARVELTTELIMKEMEYDFSNWAVIVNKYSKVCREITENPDQRLMYWLNKQ